MIKVFTVIRNTFGVLAAIMLILAVTVDKNQETFHMLCFFTLLLTIISDIVVVITHKRKGIPIKKHENYFRFGKKK